MHTILSLVSAKLHYEGGKSTGLAGLLGLGVALLIAFNWSIVKSILDFVGVTALADKLGLIHPEAGYLTFIRIIGGILGAYLIVIVFTLIVCALLWFVCTVLNSRLGDLLGKAMEWLVIALVVSFFAIICSPVLIPGYIFIGITHIIRFIKNPKQYKAEEKEKRRLNKNAVELELTRTTGIKELTEEQLDTNRMGKLLNEDLIEKGLDPFPITVQKESNEITIDKTINRLNRLPMPGDYKFIVAVTYDREFFALAPCPRYINNIDNSIYFWGVKIYVDAKTNTQTHENELIVDFDLKAFDMIEADIFEHYFDVSDSKEYNQTFRSIRINDPYKDFVKKTYERYFSHVNYLKQDMEEKSQKGEYYDDVLLKFNKFRVGNEDVVDLLRNNDINEQWAENQ